MFVKITRRTDNTRKKIIIIKLHFRFSTTPPGHILRVFQPCRARFECIQNVFQKDILNFDTTIIQSQSRRPSSSNSFWSERNPSNDRLFNSSKIILTGYEYAKQRLKQKTFPKKLVCCDTGTTKVAVDQQTRNSVAFTQTFMEKVTKSCPTSRETGKFSLFVPVKCPENSGRIS